jgi:DNA-binding response OmpR family regulator
MISNYEPSENTSWNDDKLSNKTVKNVNPLSSKNYDFDSVMDGRAGLELAVYHEYDLILLDMCMPNYSGADFLLDLKFRKPSELSKVVIVSALEMSLRQEQELLNLGIRAVLRKPISIQSLISEIEQKISI